MDFQELVELGFSRSAHGIKGGFKFTLYNIEESALTKGVVITLIPLASASSLNPQGEQFKISSISFGNKVIAYLEGVRDRNRVEELLPFKIMLERRAFPPTKRGEFYLVDLIGIKVFCHHSNRLIGEVVKMYDNRAQDVVVIRKTSGEILELPLIDQFFPVVDLENERIELNEPVEI